MNPPTQTNMPPKWNQDEYTCADNVQVPRKRDTIWMYKELITG